MEMLNSDKNHRQLNSIPTAEKSYAHDQREFKQLGYYYKSNDSITPIFDIRPHTCQLCNKYFKYRGCWERHLKMHAKLFSTDTGWF